MDTDLSSLATIMFQLLAYAAMAGVLYTKVNYMEKKIIDLENWIIAMENNRVNNSEDIAVMKNEMVHISQLLDRFAERLEKYQ